MTDFAADSPKPSLYKEPLFHFLLLGALLFVVNHFAQRSGPETIEVAPANVRHQAAERADLLQRPLTPAETNALLEQYIDEEVLVREAIRRGLNDDSQIRQRLATKMRFLLSEDFPDPTREQLREFYEAHPQKYQISRSITFEHVWFSTSSPPADLLAQLRNGANPRDWGEPFIPFGNGPRAYTETDLEQFFGPSFTTHLFASIPGQWHGPLRSKLGTHFVRTEDIQPVRTPAFNDVEPYLLQDWIATRQAESISNKLHALRQQYKIVRQPALPPRATP